MSNKNIKQIIESIVSTTLLEFRSTFSFKFFKTLKTPGEMIDYVKSNNLPFLGAGSSRTVYALPNTKYVLKIARNIKGVAQNKAELSIFTHPSTKPIVAKIYNFDPEYKWLVSETVRPIGSYDEFKSLVGIDFNALTKYLYLFKEYGENWVQKIFPDIESEIAFLKPKLEKAEKINFYSEVHYCSLKIGRLESELKTIKTIDNHPFSHVLANLLHDNDLLPSDIGGIFHWGKTADGRVVILDYGFTDYVADNFY